MSFLGMSSFGLAPKPEKRMDVANPDVEANIKAANNGDDSNDASADVHDADVNDGNTTNYGAPEVSAPKVATGANSSAGVSVQHGPGASRVNP